MPPLADARQERFAQSVARGEMLQTAARAAGYSKTTATQACVIRRRPGVSQRIAEISAQRARIEGVALARAQENYNVTTDRVIGEYARCAFANMLDYLVFDSSGKPHFDIEHVTRDQGTAIAEMIIDEYKDGKGADAREVKRVRVKLTPKLEALNALGRHLGLFVDPSVLNLNVANFFSEAPPTMDDWRKEIEASVVETKQLEAPLTRPLTRPGMPRKEKRAKPKR